MQRCVGYLKVESESSSSSLRTQGPITTGRNCLVRSSLSVFSNNKSRGVWVPAFAGTTMKLPQPQLLIPLRRHLVAPGAVRRRAAAVAGDDAPLLAFDVGIDAGHPGIDLVGQQPDAERFHM